MMQKHFTDHSVIRISLLSLLLVGAVHANVTGSLDKVSDWYPAGSNITVTAEPGQYSQLDRWEGTTEDAVITDDHIILTADGSKAITAVFAPIRTDTGGVPWWWLADLNPEWQTAEYETVVSTNMVAGGSIVWQAYLTGTDPENPDSRFEIGKVEIVDDQVRLQWEHARVDPNLPPIMLQSRTDLLNGDWVDVEPISPIDGTNTWSGAWSANIFYRLQAKRP